MQPSVVLLSLFHMSSMKPLGIKLLESAAAERDPSEWPPHAPPGLGATSVLVTPRASGAAPLGATPAPASSSGLSTNQGVTPGSAASPAPTSNAIRSPCRSPCAECDLPSSGPTASGSSSSSSHMSFGVVLGRLMPLLDDEISHGHSEDDEEVDCGRLMVREE